MLRRDFLALASLAAASCRRPPARPADCSGGFCPLPDNPLKAIPANAIDLEVKPQCVRPRPLWSRLTGPERQRLNETITLAYGRMIRRGRHDRRSLLYQAWLHQYYCYGVASIHNTARFLPWHRAFLYMHERLLQAELGDRNFRLPVWDWENDGHIPRVYNELPTISDLPCHCTRRNGIDKVGRSDLQSWLVSTSFEDFARHRSTYGVHADVHLGLGGYMGKLGTAAADPVFYAHHANVDRYWCYWWDWYKKFFQANWPQEYFYFFDEKDRAVRVKLSNLLSTESLGYYYELPDIQLFHCRSVVGRLEGGRLRFPDQDWHIVDDFLQYLPETGTTPSIEALAERPEFSLPAVIVTDQTIEGGHYSVGMKDTDDSPILYLGRFAVLTDANHHGMPNYFSICLALEAIWHLSDLVGKGTGPKLVYGPLPGNPGHIKPLQLPDDRFASLAFSSFEIRVPVKYAPFWVR
jgi:hypothetical protein